MTHLKPKTGRNCWKSFFQSRKIGVEKQQSIRYCYYIEYQSVTSDYVVHYKISCQRSQMHIYTDAHLQFSFFLLFFFDLMQWLWHPHHLWKPNTEKKYIKCHGKCIQAENIVRCIFSRILFGSFLFMFSFFSFFLYYLVIRKEIRLSLKNILMFIFFSFFFLSFSTVFNTVTCSNAINTTFYLLLASVCVILCHSFFLYFSY